MKVGFYDEKNHKLLMIENWNSGIFFARIASVKLSEIYQSGFHTMPTPIWCAWDKNEMDENGNPICSIFSLNNVVPEQEVIEKAMSLIDSLDE